MIAKDKQVISIYIRLGYFLLMHQNIIFASHKCKRIIQRQTMREKLYCAYYSSMGKVPAL